MKHNAEQFELPLFKRPSLEEQYKEYLAYVRVGLEVPQESYTDWVGLKVLCYNDWLALQNQGN